MWSRRVAVSALFLLLLFIGASEAGAQRITYKTREVASGLNVPWEMRMGPDDWIYFTERPGYFSKLNPETGEIKRLLNEPNVDYWYEAGMMGFDLHPNFPDSPYVYIAYTYGFWEMAYGIFRYRYTGDSLIDRTQIFGPALGYGSHSGSRLVIHNDQIYFSIGEVWQFMIAQDPRIPNGKIDRINLDGSIPADNPFLNSPAWSVGHRNPQGLDFAPDGTLYSSEHGDYTDDEINLIERGRNYGWPIIQGYCDSASDHPNCEDLNIREPLAAFTPTIAAGDLNYCDLSTFPEWKHSLLLATLKDQSLHQFTLSEDGRSLISHERYELEDAEGELYGRLRSFCLTKDGRIFVSTSNATNRESLPDKIFELIRTGVEPSLVQLRTPLPEEEVRYASVNLEWHSAFPNAKYEAELSTALDFSGSVILKQQVVDSAVKALLLPNTTYFWRVRELSTAGPWSEIRSFRTAAVLGVEDRSIESLSFDLLSQGRTISVLAHSNMTQVAIDVVDALGRTCASITLPDLQIHSKHSLGQFEPGVYFVRATSASGVTTKRVLLK